MTFLISVLAPIYTGGSSADTTTSVSTPAFPSQPTLVSAASQSDTAIALA